MESKIVLIRTFAIAGFLFWPCAYCQNTQSLEATSSGPLIAVNLGEVRTALVDETHGAEFDLRIANIRTARVVIQEDEPTLRFRLFSPDGETLRTVDAGYPGTIMVSFPAKKEGAYRLEVSSRKVLPSPAQIKIRLEQGPSIAGDLELQMEAEQVFSSAQLLRIDASARAAHKAILLYRYAGSKWRAGHSLDGRFLALVSEGDTWLELSRYDASLRAYSAAQELAPNAVGTMMVFNAEARVYLDWWKSNLASPLAERALQLSHTLQNRSAEAQALANRGEARYLQTEDEPAWADLTSAMDLAQETHDRPTIARILRVQSWIEKDRGRLTQAGAYMRRADQLFEELGDVRASFSAISDVATIDSLGGDTYSALVRHVKLSELIHNSGQLSVEAFAREALGADYARLNRGIDSIEYFKEAQAIFASIGHAFGEETSFGQLCEAELLLDRPRQAISFCRNSHRLSLLAHDPKRQAIAEWRLGRLAEALNDDQQASSYYKNAVRLSASVNDPRFEASAMKDLARINDRAGDHASAVTLYVNALDLSLIAEDSRGVIDARFHIAQNEAQAGRFLDAQRELDKALDLIEAQRNKVENDQLKTSYFAATRKCYELYVEILMKQYEGDATAGLDALALEKSEASRARTLLDRKAAQTGLPRNGTVQTEAPRLKLLHLALDQAYEKRLTLMLRGKPDKELAQSETEIRRLSNAYERSQDVTKQSAPRPFTAHSLSARELIDKSKKFDFVFLEYSLGPTHSYLWRIDHGVVRAFILPDRAVITRAVEHWRRLVLARQRRPSESLENYRARVHVADRELPNHASKLSCMLLRSVDIPERRSLAIIADGVLQSLPFAALPMYACSRTDGPPLITAHQISYIPSISLLVAQEDSNANREFDSDVAVFADPVFSADDPRIEGPMRRSWDVARPQGLQMALRDVGLGPILPRLPATRQEALTIARTLPSLKVSLALDFQANTRTVLNKEITKYRILHFATHGVLDEKDPDLSGLVLSLFDAKGRPIPGYLTTEDIFDLSLQTDLVVLSACDSGLGKQIDGEGTMGLSYAFLHAGVGRVVSTLWDVDDVQSSNIMAAFYRALLAEHTTASAALQEAQLDILRRKHHSQPFYWAGYVLTSSTGDPIE